MYYVTHFKPDCKTLDEAIASASRKVSKTNHSSLNGGYDTCYVYEVKKVVKLPVPAAEITDYVA